MGYLGMMTGTEWIVFWLSSRTR